MEPIEIAKVHDALTETQGDRKIACQLLQKSSLWIKNAINNTPELKAVWGEKKVDPASPAEALHRPAIGRTILIPGSGGDFDEPPPISDEEIGKALLKEGKDLAKGLRSIGLTVSEAAVAEEMQKFYGGGHFKSAFDIVSCGALRASVKIQTALDAAQERLAWVRKQLENFGDGTGELRMMLVEEEKILMQHYENLAGEARKMAESAMKGLVAVARLRAAGKQAGRGGKPGFSSAGGPQ